jgi:hypothetical protein
VVSAKSSTSAQKVLQASTALPNPTKVSGFYVLGTWNSSGFPNYLSLPNDVISKEFLEDVNATLPENIKLQNSQPEYFKSSDDGSVVLVEDAEVWVTFVHEGAGHRNTLGYYTHPNDNPPARKEDIRDATIIFPNVSFSGSGGMLASGNKSTIAISRSSNQIYTQRYFLQVQRLHGGFVRMVLEAVLQLRFRLVILIFIQMCVSILRQILHLRKHNVLLRDDKRQLLLIGFEDLHREQTIG